jgi:aspartate/methionine/tyrosine aminotransferase
LRHARAALDADEATHLQPIQQDTGGAALFANRDYVGWYRTIFELIRGGEPATMLFDSTIAEPSGLLVEHARRALADDYGFRFASTFGWGSPLLISAIARRYGAKEGSILTTTGCTSAIAHVYSTFLGPGAHAVIETPHFHLLPRLAALRNAHISFIEREHDTFAIDPDRLASLVDSRTKLIVLTNAHNPSGAYLDDAALREIARVANRFGVPVLVDEVYADFVPKPRRSGPAALLDPCFVTVSSLTKAYGLQALRCGWIIASEEILRKVRPVYSELESGSSKLTHGISSLVLDELDLYADRSRAQLAQNRPFVQQVSDELVADGLIAGAVPEDGCMYFPRVLRTADTRQLAAWMWDRSRVGIAPGEFFGAAGHVRIGYGQRTEELRLGLEQFAEALRAYE